MIALFTCFWIPDLYLLTWFYLDPYSKIYFLAQMKNDRVDQSEIQQMAGLSYWTKYGFHI